MNTKEIKKVSALLKDALCFYFAQSPVRELDLDDKVYMNLVEVVWPFVKEHPYYGEDLFLSAVSWHIEKYETMPENIGAEEVENLIQDIKKCFDLNKQKHYLVVPLQNSTLKKDFTFDRFYFLKEDEEDILIQKISELSQIDMGRVSDFLEHTKKSRSKDFLKSNLLVIKVENQTENIRRSAYQIAQNAIDSILLLHAGIEHQMSAKDLFHPNLGWLEKNSHVAILSTDGWRCGHGFDWQAHLSCDVDLDFFEDEVVQQKFVEFYNLFNFKSTDEFTYRFYNSFSLYSKARVQRIEQKENSVALLLYLTAIESLVTEGRNEKRLRVSAITPKLIQYRDITQADLSRKLNDMYTRRNNFVHAGTGAYWRDETEELELLEKVVAKLILRVTDIESELDIREGETKWHAWERYVNGIFDDIIFGVDVPTIP